MFSKKMSGLLLLFALVLPLSGCAFGIYGLATNGTRQNITIDSTPSGATVEIEGQIAKTPAQFNLKRSRDYVAVITKDGYESTRAYINKEADPLVLYLDGFLLPHLFKTAWDLEPERVHITLSKTTQE